MDSYINLNVLITSHNLSVDKSWVFCLDNNMVCEILFNHTFKKHIATWGNIHNVNLSEKRTGQSYRSLALFTLSCISEKACG